VNQPFSRLIEAGALTGYRYEGFWRAMATMRDRQCLRTWSRTKPAVARQDGRADVSESTRPPCVAIA